MQHLLAVAALASLMWRKAGRYSLSHLHKPKAGEGS